MQARTFLALGAALGALIGVSAAAQAAPTRPMPVVLTRLISLSGAVAAPS